MGSCRQVDKRWTEATSWPGRCRKRGFFSSGSRLAARFLSVSLEDLEKKTPTPTCTSLNLGPSPSQKAFFSSWSRMAWIRRTASFRASRTVSWPPVSTESSTSSSLVSSSSRHR